MHPARKDVEQSDRVQFLFMHFSGFGGAFNPFLGSVPFNARVREILELKRNF